MISKFTDPFRYSPHPLVRSAAESVISDLDRRIEEGLLPEEVCKGFKEGKMLGILICEGEVRGNLRHLAAFSGSVGGRNVIDGFVPPIYDLLDPKGYFKTKEAEISSINQNIARLESSSQLQMLNNKLQHATELRNNEIEAMRARMAASKAERDRRREEGCASETLIKESQFEKAELKRLKIHHEAILQEISSNILNFKSEIARLKQLRASMSDALQEWIFKQYIVHNSLGEESSIHDIFTSQGLIPQGGTGDCAAPKLLEYAYCHNLKPLAMGEFWYGTSPDTAVRTHGHFYPSCTSKCGPLLGYMLKGLTLENCYCSDIPDPAIIFDDDTLIAVSKPSGMPSVPGLDGRVSAQEWLSEIYGEASIHPVHRLDMDTSGILLFAKTAEAAVELRRQFEEHTISKTYLARLCPISAEDWKTELLAGDKGRIELPLAPDYDERPRQKVDRHQGKEAVTEYEILSTNPDGTVEIAFHPVTGRTHQLRIHSAHHLGLGRPILGDMLYGGQNNAVTIVDGKPFTHNPQRLHLHALRITFRHPASGSQTTIESDVNIY